MSAISKTDQIYNTHVLCKEQQIGMDKTSQLQYDLHLGKNEKRKAQGEVLCVLLNRSKNSFARYKKGLQVTSISLFIGTSFIK